MLRKLLFLCILLIMSFGAVDIACAKNFEPDEQINITVYEKLILQLSQLMPRLLTAFLPEPAAL